MLEKLDLRSVLVLLATVTAVEIQPGADTESTHPLLPDAITVGMPAASKLSIAGFLESVSQAEK